MSVPVPQPPTVPYCEQSDLLLGDIPTPAYVEKNLYISNAAEEIDAALSVRYQTPVLLDPEDPTHRPARLILKKINAHIASGRIISAAAAGSEDGRVHAYAEMLLREARTALAALVAGNPVLVGAIPLSPDSRMSDKPFVLTADPVSSVDEFYRMTQPSGQPLRAEGFFYGIGW